MDVKEVGKRSATKVVAEKKVVEKRKESRFVSFLNGLITFSLVAIAFGVPIFFTGLAFQGAQFEKQIYFYVWVLIALVCWVTKGVLDGELQVRKTSLDFPILGILVTYALSVVFSIDKWHSFWGFFGDPSRGLLNVLTITVLYYIVMSHFTERRLAFFAHALILANVFIAIWTTLVIFGIKFLPTQLMGIAPLSLIGSISGLGIFFAIMLPILMATILVLSQKETFSKSVWQKIIAGVYAFLILLNLFLIFSFYSFVPWLAIVVGISLFLIFVIARIVNLKGGWTGLPIAVFALVVLMLLIGSSFGDFKIAKIDLPVEVSPNYQLSWDIAKQAIKDNFFVGSGPGTYGYVFSKFKPQSFNLNPYYDLRFYQGTGLFLELFSTVGALASIALLITVLSFFGIGPFLITRDKERNRVYSLGLFVASIIFLTSAFSVRIEGSILIIGAFISILAFATMHAESSAEKTWRVLSLQSSPKFALALAFVFTLVSASVIFVFMFLGKVFVADIYVQKSVHGDQVSEDGSISQIAKAINLNNKEGRYFVNVAQQYMILANNEFMKKEEERNVNALQQYIINANDFGKKAESLMGKDVSTVEATANIAESTTFFIPSAEKTAEEQYQKALDLEPHNPAFFLKLGQLKMSLASSKKDAERADALGQANDFFKKSITEKENFAAGYFNSGLALSALGKEDEAIDEMGKAVQIENNNVTYLFNLGQLYQKRNKNDDLKVAEALYREVLKYNADETNTHIALGILYENQKKNDQAIEQYNKVLDLIPKDATDLVTKVQKLISNVKEGKQNTFENLVPAQEETQNPTEIQPAQ